MPNLPWITALFVKDSQCTWGGARRPRGVPRAVRGPAAARAHLVTFSEGGIRGHGQGAQLIHVRLLIRFDLRLWFVSGESYASRTGSTS